LATLESIRERVTSVDEIQMMRFHHPKDSFTAIGHTLPSLTGLILLQLKLLNCALIQ